MKALWVGTNAETLANAQQRWVLAEPLGDSVVLPIEALSSVGGELAGYDLVLLAATEEALVVHPALDQLLQLDVPVLVTAAPAQEAIALQLLQRGASDYVLIVSDQSYDGLVCKAQRLTQAHRHCHHQEQPPSPQTDAAAIAALTNRISSANQVPDRAMAIAEGLQAILGADQICLMRNQGGQPGDVVATSVSEVGRSPETETAGGPRVGAKPSVANYWDGQLHVIDGDGRDRGTYEEPPGALMIVPIHHANALWGAWVVAQWSRSRCWTPDEITLLQFAAQSIQQALCIQELRQVVQQERQHHTATMTALADTSEMYANILGSISDAVFITNDAGHFTFICPNVATIFGYQQADVVAMGSIQALLGEALFDLEELRNRGELSNLERRVDDQWGCPHDLLINVKQVDIDSGSVLYTCRDISDRKQAEIHLQHSERDYRLLIEHLPAGVVVHNSKTEILSNNTRATELLELTSEQMRGKAAIDPAWCFLDAEGHPLPLADYPVNQVIATGQPLNNEVIGVNRPASGTQIWALVNAYPLFKADQTLDRVIVTFVDITPQKQAQFALIASEQRYASLAQAAPVGIFRTDRDGKCVYVNDRWAAIAGMSPEQALGHGWVEGLHPDDRAAIASEWYTAAQNLRPFSLEYRFLNPTQAVTWVYGQAVAEVDAQGQVTGYIGTVTDITERYLAEKQLQASESRYRLLFDIANDIVLLHPLGTAEQPGQHFTDVNATACELLGYTRAEFRQLTPLDLIPPLELEEVPGELDILTTQGQLLFEKTLIAKDGHRIPVELHAHVFEWEGQTMVLSIARDISERKLVQAKLAARERLFRATFDQSAVAMAMVFPDGHFIRVNQCLLTLLGYHEAELLDIPAAELRHPDYRATAHLHMQQLLQGDQDAFSGDERFLQKNGCPIWLNTCVSLVRDEAGQPEYFLEVWQDVSDRVQAHNALAASEALFRDTFAQAAVGITHVAPEGSFIRLNERFCELVGYTHDELMQLTFSDLTHPDDLELDLAQTRRLLNGELYTHSLKKRYIRKDGLTIWVHLTVSLVRTAQGDPDYFIAVIQDISDLKAVEERLSLALSAASQGIYDLNLITDQAIVGREYALMLGYDPDTFTETVTSWRERVHPDDRALVTEAYRAYVAGETSQYRAEFRMRTQQGTWRWMLSVGKFVEWDADGQPRRLLGTHTDINDRKQAEAQLQVLNQTLEKRVLDRTQALSVANDQLQRQTAELHQTNQLLQLVMDSIPQRIFWKDRDLTLLGCNRHFAADMGLTVEAAIGRDNHEFSATSEEAEFFDGCDRQVIESGQPSLHILETLHRADGTVIHLDTSKVPLRNEQGEVIGMLGCYEDITQRRTIEARLHQQLQKEQLLSSLMQQMRETLDLQEILQLAVEQVRQLLKIHRVLIYTIDDDYTGQIVAASVDCECLPLPSPLENLQPISSECYHNYLTGKVYAVSQMQATDLPDCMTLSADQAIGIAAKVVVPIVDHERHRVWGLLIGHQCEQPRTWQTWEIEFLEQLSHHLVIAIRQIRLYEQLQVELQQRKQVERSLRASEARLKLVTDSVNGCIAYVDAAQRYQFINQTYEDWFGWQKSEILGQTIESIIGPEAYAQTQNYVERALAGETVNYEAQLPYQSGGTRYVIASLVPDRGPDEVVNGYFALITDISDRKQAELALQKSRHFIEQIANASPNLIYLYDLVEGRNLYVNQEIGKALGYAPDELQAMGSELLTTLMHPKDWARYQLYLPQLTAARDGEVLEFEYRVQHRDGNWHWMTSRDTVFARDATGQVTQVIGSAQDITDRKQTEALIQSQAAREKLLREITQRIRNTLELSTIFTTACDEILQMLQCDRVGIFQFDPESNFTIGEFIAESTASNWSSILEIPVEDHCFGERYAAQYRQGRYLIANDITAGEVSNCHAQILEEFGVKACMVMPLLQGDDLWGLLCVHQCREPRHWQSAEIDLVHQLAIQMAIAIQQAKFHAQIQSELVVRKKAERQIARQLREQQTLAAITQVTRESLDVAEILATVTAQVQDILNGDRVIIFRLFDDGRAQIIEEAVEPHLPQLRDQHWDDEMWSPDILARYWQDEPRIVPDVMDDVWTECLQAYSRAGQIRSKLVAPILQQVSAAESNRWTHPTTHTKIWGLLVVHACHQRRQWQPPEARLLQQIANQLAIAIRQASLFGQLQTELQERQHAQNLLTERNQQLASSNEQLAHATRMKGEFLANVSHEIRTPMNAIIGMTKLALDTSLTAKQRDYLAKIDKSAATLLHIINDILDFSKIEADKLQLEAVPFSLEDVLSHLSDVTTLHASQKGLELLFNVAMDTPLNLIGDPLRLGQILLNLVSNAIKFTEQGHVLVSVERLSTPEPDYTLRFAVTDTGIGLTAEQQTRLFQAFSQGDTSTTRKFGGTGLGLAISKRLVTLMQGEIGVDSTLQVGSTFWFTATFKPPSVPTSASLHQQNLEHLKGLRVLVVDDNAAARTIFQEVLTSFQFEPTVLDSAESAIAAIQTAEQANAPFEVVIVDYVMPNTDGITLIQQLRQLITAPQLPAILLMTAHRQLVVKETAQAAGIQHLLYKPLRPSQLLDTIVKASGPMTTAPGPEAADPEPLVHQAATLADIHVLLVEDHEINQALAVELLKQAKAQVTVANNGQEAYDRVCHDTFDVVLMDCQMPIMDGYEATRLIRTLPEGGQVPIIAMTANAMPGDRQKCLNAGMNDYLAKPIFKDEMYATICRWVSSKQVSPSSASQSSMISTDATASMKTSLPDERWQQLSTFNTALGLNYVGDNAELYTKLLRQFLNKHREFSSHFQAAIEQANYPEATRLAHNLKGLCGTLGCVELQQRAQQLEQSLHQETANFDPVTLDAVIEQLTIVIAELEAWEENQFQTSASLPNPSEMDWPKFLSEVHQMCENLEMDLGAALGQLTALQVACAHHPEAGEIVDTLSTALNNFDIDRAQQILPRLVHLAESHIPND